MLKHKLNLEPVENDQDVICVNTVLPSYLFVFNLNRLLGLSLQRSNEDIVLSKSNHSFAVYAYDCSIMQQSWHVVENCYTKAEKAFANSLFDQLEQRAVLFPQLDRVDLLVCVNGLTDSLLKKIQSLGRVLSCYRLPKKLNNIKEQIDLLTMRKIKKTKIVATLGPASSSREIIGAMMENGVNVFRINFSHADYEDVLERIQIIRELNQKLGFQVAILADLQGPKLRVGVMTPGTLVEKGQEVRFTTQKVELGTADAIYMNYKQFPKDVSPGERVLLDDGKLIFEVVSTDKKENVIARVIQGGELKSKKGVNLPNTNISLPALTKKDN